MRGCWRSVKTALVFVLLLPLLSGCWDRLDPENMALIVAIGVDPGPQNDYLFTFALAAPKSINSSIGGGGQSSRGSEKKTLSLYTVESANIASALQTSQSFIARKLTLIHSKVFIFGETMARKGIMPILSEVVRNREFRRTMYVLTTHGNAETFIKNIMPTTETDISLWFELELDPNDMGSVIPRSPRFHDFIMDIENSGSGAITIQTAPRPDVQQNKTSFPEREGSSGSDVAQPFAGNQNAGKIRRVGETPVEFFGTAVYKSSKLAGFLKGSETLILNMLRGEFLKTSWDFSDPADTKLNLTIDMKAQRQTKINVSRNDDSVKVSFHAALEGTLNSVQTNVDYTKLENEKMLEKSIEKQIRDQSIKLLQKTLHEWQTDCYHINNRVKTTFSTQKEWDEFKWYKRVKDIEYDVDINFKMRRYGDQVGPAVEGDKIQ